MIEETSHLAIVHDERAPKRLLDELCAELTVDHLHIQRIERPAQGPLLSLEWLAIPIVAVFLLKPYFNGFMTEAGKDHYVVLKKALKGLWNKVFGKERELRVSIVTVSGEKKQRYSLSLAVYTVLEDGRRIKLVLPEDCSREEYVASIDAFLDSIEALHSGNPSSECKKLLRLENNKGWELVVRYDTNSKSLRIVDPIQDLRDRDIGPVDKEPRK